MKQQNPVILFNNLAASIGKKGLFKNNKSGLSSNSQQFASLFNQLKNSINSGSYSDKKSTSENVISNLKELNFITESGNVNEKLVSLLPIDNTAKEKISQYLRKIADAFNDTSITRNFNSNIRSLSSSYAQMSSESVPQNTTARTLKNASSKSKQHSVHETERKSTSSETKSGKTASVIVGDSETTLTRVNNVNPQIINDAILPEEKAKKHVTEENKSSIMENSSTEKSKNAPYFSLTKSKSQKKVNSNISSDRLKTSIEKPVFENSEKAKNIKGSISKESSTPENEKFEDKNIDTAKKLRPDNSTFQKNSVTKEKSVKTESTQNRDEIKEQLKSNIGLNSGTRKSTETIDNNYAAVSDKVNSDRSKSFNAKAKKESTVKAQAPNYHIDESANSTKVISENYNKTSIDKPTQSAVTGKSTGNPKSSSKSSVIENSETFKTKAAFETNKASKIVENTVDSKTSTILKTEDVAEDKVEPKKKATIERNRYTRKIKSNNLTKANHRTSVSSYLKSKSTNNHSITVENRSTENVYTRIISKSALSRVQFKNSSDRNVNQSESYSGYLNSSSKVTVSDNHNKTRLSKTVAPKQKTEKNTNRVPVKTLRQKASVKSEFIAEADSHRPSENSTIRNSIVKTVLMRKAKTASYTQNTSKYELGARKTDQQNKIFTGATQRVFSNVKNLSGNTTSKLSNVNMQAISNGIQNKPDNQSLQKESTGTVKSTFRHAEREVSKHDESTRKTNFVQENSRSNSESKNINNPVNQNINIDRKDNKKSSAEKITQDFSLKQTNAGKTHTLNREPVISNAKDSNYTKALNTENIEINTKHKGVDAPQNFSKESKYSFDDSEVVSPLENKKSFTATPKATSNTTMIGINKPQQERAVSNPETYTKSEYSSKAQSIKHNQELKGQMSQPVNPKVIKTETVKSAETPKNSEQANVKENTSEPVAVKTNHAKENISNTTAESKTAPKTEVLTKQETIKNNTEVKTEQPKTQNVKVVKTETAKFVETPKNSEQVNVKENTSEPVAVKTNYAKENISNTTAESKTAPKPVVLTKQETIKNNTEVKTEQIQTQNVKAVKTETVKSVETPKNTEQANVKENTSEPVAVKSELINEKVSNTTAESKTAPKTEVLTKQETIKNNTEIKTEQIQTQDVKVVKTETAKFVETPKNTEQANVKENTSEPVAVKTNPEKENVSNTTEESKTAPKTEVLTKQETIKNNTEVKTEQPQTQNVKAVKTETVKSVETPKNTEQANVKENTSEPVAVKSELINEKVSNTTAESKTAPKTEVLTKQETIKNNTEIKTEQPQTQNVKVVKTETAKFVETPKNSEQANFKENTSESVVVKNNHANEKFSNTTAANKTAPKPEVLTEQETIRNNTEVKAEQPKTQNVKAVKTETAQFVETPKNSEQANVKENTSESVIVKSNNVNEKLSNTTAESKTAPKPEVLSKQETIKNNTEIKTEQPQTQDVKAVKTETAQFVETTKNTGQANVKENTSEPVAVKSKLVNEKIVNTTAESKTAPKQKVIATQETIKNNTEIKTEKSEEVSLKNEAAISDRKPESDKDFQESVMVDKKADNGYSLKANSEEKAVSKANPEKNNHETTVQEKYTHKDYEAISDKRLFYNIRNSFHKSNPTEEKANRTILKLDDEESITKFLNSIKMPDLEKLHAQKTQNTEPTQNNYVRRPEAKNESMNNSSDNKNENYNGRQGNSENFSKNENEVFRATLQDQQFDTAYSSAAAKSQTTVPSYNGTSINQIYDKIFNELKSFEINSKSSLFKEADFKLRTDDFGEITANLVKENNNLQVTISVKNEAHLQTLRDQLSDMNKSLEKLGFDEVEVNYRFDNEEHHNQHSHNRQRNILNRQNAFHTLKEESDTQQLMSMKRENTTIEYII